MLLRKRGKKGIAILEGVGFTFIDTIILAAVFFFLFQTASTQVNNPILEETYLAADLALYADTLLAAPYTTFSVYTQPRFSSAEEVGGFRMTLEAGENPTVAVYTGTQQERAGTTYPYHPDNFLTQNVGATENRKSVFFAKTSNQFFVGDTFSLKSRVVTVPPLATAPITNLLINLEPSIQATTPEMVTLAFGDTTSVSPIAASLSGEVMEGIPFPEKKRKTLEGRDGFLTLQSYGGKSVIAFIPLESVKSRKLAALIVNGMSVPGFVVPVNKQYLEEEDPRMLLRSTLPSVHLLIPETLAEGEVSSAIVQGLQAYAAAPSIAVEEADKKPGEVLYEQGKRLVRLI